MSVSGETIPPPPWFAFLLARMPPAKAATLLCAPALFVLRARKRPIRPRPVAIQFQRRHRRAPIRLFAAAWLAKVALGLARPQPARQERSFFPRNSFCGPGARH